MWDRVLPMRSLHISQLIKSKQLSKERWVSSGFGLCCSDVVPSSPAIRWLLGSPSDAFAGAAEAAVGLPHAWSSPQQCQVSGSTPRAATLSEQCYQ